MYGYGANVIEALNFEQCYNTGYPDSHELPETHQKRKRHLSIDGNEMGRFIKVLLMIDFS